MILNTFQETQDNELWKYLANVHIVNDREKGFSLSNICRTARVVRLDRVYRTFVKDSVYGIRTIPYMLEYANVIGLRTISGDLKLVSLQVIIHVGLKITFEWS